MLYFSFDKKMKFTKTFLYTVLSITCAQWANAEVAQSKNDTLDKNIQVAAPKLQAPAIQPKTNNEGSVSMTKEELARHPDLIVRGMIPSVLQNNEEAVSLLLPLYRELPKKDPVLLSWAEAIDARHKGNYSEAAQRYRTLFTQHSDSLPLRYQLAQALFLNNDNEAAKDQFQKLRAEQMTPEMTAVIDQYLSALNQRDQWKFYGGVSYLNESNINNAPKAGTHIGNWKAWSKESAQGLSYSLGVEKKWSLAHNFFTKLGLDGNGKYYWNNKKYNELNARLGWGLGYQTSHLELALTPFTEKRWYSGGSNGSDALKQYSKNSGVRFDISYWLNPRWQISSALEYGEQRYDWRKHLNGNNYLFSNTLLYVPKSGQHWFAGVDYSRENTRDKDNAYQRVGGRLGWGQEWPWGISSRVTLSYAKRHYQAADFFNIRQKNREYASTLTLWHRDLYFWGITPKITWSYQKVKSNHPFYGYDKNRIFLEMSKTF